MTANGDRITRDTAIKLTKSYMSQYKELPSTKVPYVNWPRKERAFLISENVVDLHRKIMKFPQCAHLLDPPPSDKEFNEMSDERREHYIENTLQRIAIGFDVTLDADKPPSTTQLIVNVSQVNVQNLNNLVEVVNSLAISNEDKENITKLVQEFDEEVKSGKNKEKLRNILYQVAELSIDAASFLLKHAHSMGVLHHLLS